MTDKTLEDMDYPKEYMRLTVLLAKTNTDLKRYREAVDVYKKVLKEWDDQVPGYLAEKALKKGESILNKEDENDE